MEGGTVASGSTCGVVTGGSLGLALIHEGSPELLELAGNYVDWFKDSIGTTNCMERTGVDFHKATGQIRYFLPGDRVMRCMSHIWKAVNFLISDDKGASLQDETMSHSDVPKDTIHCAQSVLRQVRENTGVGNPSLEKASIVFDGGVGLKGGLCGALEGAIMAMNLVHGTNIRQMNRPQIMKSFVIGHINLIRDRPIAMPEPFAIGKQIAQEFRPRAGSIECREITGRDFKNGQDFNDYISSSKKCKDLIHFSAELASNAIDRWRHT